MHRGIIAAGHRATAEAGARVLADGGNAIDAAIAAMAMACVAEPVLCSPGGGGFAMVRNPDRRIELIDFFPHTPRHRRTDLEPGTGVWEAITDFGTTTQLFHIGPSTTATPGFPAGLAMLARLGATATVAELVAPAADTARIGIEITPFQAYLGTVVAPILTATPSAAAVFATDGEPPAAGDRWANPGLGDALELLAKDGLTDSDIGRALIESQATAGHLTAEDLHAYEAVIREPLTLEFGPGHSATGAGVDGDRTMAHLNPRPSAGGVLIAHSLTQLEGGEANGAAANSAVANSAVDAIAMAEAFRATGRQRHRLVPGPMRQKGTTHISVIDSTGTAVAVTVSNGEGNGVVVGDFGFMANNILGEEDVNRHGTDWPVDTRLASMMCPTIVERADGGLAVLGSGGSNRIRTAMAQVLARLGAGSEIDEAVTAPRLHVEGDRLDVEPGFAPEVVERLLADFPDHLAWDEPNMFYGGVHTVGIDGDGNLSGIGDARRDGAVIAV